MLNRRRYENILCRFPPDQFPEEVMSHVDVLRIEVSRETVLRKLNRTASMLEHLPHGMPTSGNIHRSDFL